MAFIVEINNPFEPLVDNRSEEIAGGITIFEYLVGRDPHFVEFPRPTICVINGEAVLRKYWKTRIIREEDIVNFIAIVQSPAVWIAIAVISAIVSVAIALSVPKPATPGQQPEPDPVYDLKGQVNQNRLGAPVEDAYGRCRLFPSYAARPYNKFINNEQYQYQLFCLGHGEFEIHSTLIEDTEIDNFQDVEFEYYAPGETVELFPDNVVTSVEVGGIELKGTNEAGYGMSGPYVANSSGTDANKLEIDVTLPGGLYLGNSKGGLDPITVTALFEYREIDDGGSPVGSWTTLASFTKTLRTNTPQRFTLEATVTAGRYEVRGQRTNAKNEDSKAQNLLRWEGLRAFLPSTKDYGDKTLFALKARASNNLNDKSSNRINMFATRKLPIWNGTTWSANTATRNPVWIACNILRSEYGGQVPDEYIDLAEALTLAGEFTTDGINFDFVFEQRLTVWEALKTCLRVGRTIPMLEGSLITFIRDREVSLPTAGFNQENIVFDSFVLNTVPARIDEFDGLEIEYVDPDTWKPETILCLVGGEAGDNPEKVKLFGCTSRTVAYREGLYMRAVRKKLRQSVEFTTGLEGHLPSYNDLILVVHDVPKWSTGGLVVAIAGDNVTVTLNVPVTFGVGTHEAVFSKKDGSLTEPIVVTAGSSDYEFVLAEALDPADFIIETNRELPRFYFGLQNFVGTKCKVVGLYPQRDKTVQIKAIVNDDVFDGDGETPAALPSPPLPPPVPDVPVLDCTLVIFAPVLTEERRGLISWKPALGAIEYRVEISSNGTDWELAGVTQSHYLHVDIEPGEPLFARVQAVGKGGSSEWCNPAWSGDDVPDVVTPPSPRYEDIFLDQVTPSTVTYSCRRRGGEAELVGKNEYDGFVTTAAPKRFRRVDIYGSGRNDVYSDSGCTTKTGDVETVFSGFYVWNALTGATTNSTVTQPYADGVAGTPGTLSVTQTSPIDTPICDFDRVYTQKSRTVIGNGDCCIDGSNYKKGSGTWKQILSDEDTEEDAIARVIAALVAAPPSSDPDGWDDFALCNGDSTLPCCVSEWHPRPNSYTFDYYEAQFRILATGLIADGFNVVAVKIQRTNLTTSETEPAETQIFEVYADEFGELTFDIDLPNVPGFSHFVSEVKYYVLKEGLSPIP